MSSEIIHKGTVKKIGHDSITVSINPNANDCGGCSIAGLCNKGEAIEFPYKNPTPELIGKHVTITSARKAQRKAMVLMLLVPLVILIAVIILAQIIGINELWSSIMAISATAIWFIAIAISMKHNQPYAYHIDFQ